MQSNNEITTRVKQIWIIYVNTQTIVMLKRIVWLPFCNGNSFFFLSFFFQYPFFSFFFFFQYPFFFFLSHHSYTDMCLVFCSSRNTLKVHIQPDGILRAQLFSCRYMFCCKCSILHRSVNCTSNMGSDPVTSHWLFFWKQSWHGEINRTDLIYFGPAVVASVIQITITLPRRLRTHTNTHTHTHAYTHTHIHAHTHTHTHTHTDTNTHCVIMTFSTNIVDRRKTKAIVFCYSQNFGCNLKKKKSSLLQTLTQ